MSNAAWLAWGNYSASVLAANGFAGFACRDIVSGFQESTWRAERPSVTGSCN